MFPNIMYFFSKNIPLKLSKIGKKEPEVRKSKTKVLINIEDDTLPNIGK